jgi:hypothetical protein
LSDELDTETLLMLLFYKLIYESFTTRATCPSQ